MRKRVYAAVATVAAVVFGFGMLAAVPVPAVAAPPTTDSLGAAGPCGIVRTTRQAPLVPWSNGDDDLVTTLLPTGDVDAPTGGRCAGDHRPLVLFAHGYLAVLTDLYDGVLTNLVSRGYVVVFSQYQAAFDPPLQYKQMQAGIDVALAALGERVDTDDLGIVGHSMGGGMVPWLMQQAASRGWGGTSFWAALMNPYYSWEVGRDAIDVPADARVVVIAGDYDTWLDNRIGISTFHALDVPYDQKQHVTYRSDFRFWPVLLADHVEMGLSWTRVPQIGPVNELDTQGYFRAIDATATCARTGADEACGADLNDVGTKNGIAIKPAVSTDDPRDAGPYNVLQPCDFFLNPRPC